MKKRIFSLFVMLVLVFMLPQSAMSELIQNDGRNSVAVVVEVSNIDNVISTVKKSTCFFVGNAGENPQYALTSFKAVEDYLLQGSGERVKITDKQYPWKNRNIKMSLRIYFNESYLEASVIDSDSIRDIALLKLEKPTDMRKPAIIQIPNEEMVGEEVYIVAYPTFADAFLESAHSCGTSDSYISVSRIGRLITTSGTVAKWIQSQDINIGNGCSGAPLLADNGAVIGLVSKTIYANEKDSDFKESAIISSNIEMAVDILNRNGIEYQVFENSLQTKSQEQPEPAQDQPLFESEDNQEAPLWVYIAALAAGISIISAFIILLKALKLKKQKASETISQTIPVKGNMLKFPSVRSLSLQHGGKLVHIRNNTVYIGRSSDNNIIFSENTAGVSAHHCCVSWDTETQDYIIIDMYSTYGTFLENGYKLEAKTPYHLKNGDRFYLGERENMLLLCMN